MQKAILFGNGVNAYLGINDLWAKSINERFRNNVVIYSPIIEKLYDVIIGKDFFISLDKEPKDTGIETLAGILYKYIKENKKGRWTKNDEYRIQDIIACICITSIFYTQNGKINPVYDTTKKLPIATYDFVYTLNYYEFWDVDDKSIHLHGKVDLSKLGDESNPVLISKHRMSLDEYAQAVAKIKQNNSIIEYTPNDVIFAPEGVDKDKLVCVTGIYLSNNLFPANDLFLYKNRKNELYEELDQIDELDVFGMSPKGDNGIIDKINQKKKVRIYVYQMNTNEETEIWKEKLACDYELLDSSEFTKNV